MTRTFVATSLAAALLATVPAATATEETPEPAVAAPATDPMAFARGARAWGNTCSRCHAIRDAREFDDAEWQVIVTHMRVRAGLTGPDARDIQRFLQQSN